LEVLSKLASSWYGISYGELRLNPDWDSLRGDPRFEKLLEEVKKPLALESTPPVPAGIAVLPFENLSADPENAFFADGVQDEILNDLAKIADLKVISRTSVMQYKSGAKRNLHQIANELGVAHVVEGSVQRVANRVRVSTQLIDAKTDTHLWATVTIDHSVTSLQSRARLRKQSPIHCESSFLRARRRPWLQSRRVTQKLMICS
jgi:TolB-like protein